MIETELEVRTSAGKMRVFVAYPDRGESLPLAVISPDGLGYRDELKDIARRYATSGYCCVLPDWAHRFGVTGDVFKDPEALSRLRKRLVEVLANPRETFLQDARALFEYIGSQGFGNVDRVVTVGYCWGAVVTVHLLAEFTDKVVAGAGYHPFWLGSDGQSLPMHMEGAPEPPEGVAEVPPSLLDELDRVRGELYFGVPQSDHWISQASFQFFAEAMAEREVRGGVEVYAGTHHGFAVPGGPTSNRDGSERHFERTLDLWQRNLG